MRGSIGSSLRLISETGRSAYDFSHRSGPAPLVRFLSVLVYIITVASFDRYDLSGLAAMLILPVIFFQVCGISLRRFVCRFRYVMPFVVFAGVLNPLFDRDAVFYIGNIAVTGGMISMMTLILKGFLCLASACLLAETTTIDSLCAGLRRIHVSPYVLTLFLLTWRYLEVIGGEASAMMDAYKLRAPGQRGIGYRTWGSFTGQLLIRSVDRAEDIYDTMCIRGYDGEFFYADSARCGMKDILFLVLVVLFCAIVRILPVARLLRGLIVG